MKTGPDPPGFSAGFSAKETDLDCENRKPSVTPPVAASLCNETSSATLPRNISAINRHENCIKLIITSAPVNERTDTDASS